MHKAWILFLGISLASLLHEALGTEEREAEILQTLMKDYDGRVRPPVINGTKGLASQVTVNFYMRSIEDLNTKDMTYRTQLTFRIQWVDPRLAFSDPNLSYLTIPSHLRPKIWRPDLFFSNEKEYKQHDGIEPNEYYRVFPNGEVLYSTRISLTLTCPMNLQMFPFDRQTCSIRMASYGYTTDHVIFRWKETSPIQITSSLHLEGFGLSKFTTDYCDSVTNTGTYSCLRLDLEFYRASSWFCKKYVQMVVAVLAVWISMFLHPMEPNNALIRMMVLGAATFFCSWASHDVTSVVGRISYTTAFDSWNCALNVFLFLAFLELVLASQLGFNTTIEHHANSYKIREMVNNWKNEKVGGKLDLIMRIIYPIAFATFLIYYYCSYLVSAESDQDDL